MSRTRIILIIVALALGVGMFYAYTTKTSIPDGFNNPIQFPLISNKEYRVLRVHVLTSEKYDVVLFDNRRIIGQLDVRVPEEAREKIIDLFNHSTNPCLIHKGSNDVGWVVDFELTVDGADVKLSEWLKKNNLVWEN